MTSILLALAIACIALIVLGWIVYPLSLRIFPRSRSACNASPLPPDARAVTVVIATRDSPELVGARVDNLRTSDYPAAQLAIVVALDASVAAQVQRYRTALGDRALVVAASGSAGKPGALNAGVHAAATPILVFTDSAQTFAVDTIRLLAAALAEGPYAAMSGRLVTNAASRERGVADHFWNYEVWLRRREAQVHSVIGVTGAAYAMRRELWRDLPDGVLCDDMMVPMRLVLAGHRIGMCDAAMALDTRRFAPLEEYRRKVRTQTGNLQLCRLVPAVLSPLRNPVWLQFVCHKMLRIATPLLLLLAAPGILLTLWRLTSPALGTTQLWALGATLAMLTLAVATLPVRLFGQLRTLVLMLSAPLPAIYFAVTGKWDVWSRSAGSVAPTQQAEKL